MKEEKIKGVWEIFDLEANRKIQEMLMRDKYQFRFYAKLPNKQLICRKEKIEETLKKINFANWDRFFTYPNGLSVFGWIDRDDGKKDFVLLEFMGELMSFATSSKKYTEKIAEILNLQHSDCQRVEDCFDIENVIKLGDKKDGKK